MREIGSEYWKENKFYIQSDETLFLCGRTALEAIVREAVESFGITSVLMPSYCCHTMLEPVMRNVGVRFYDIVYDEVGFLSIPDTPKPIPHEMILLMTYFGDVHLRGFEKIDQTLWTCSVEDMTHSCFSKQTELKQSCSRSTYSFASYRKWFAVDGVAIARKKNGQLRSPSKPANFTFSSLRNQAFDLKNRFIEHGETLDKQQFLSLFNEAGDALSADYVDRAPDINSVIELAKFKESITDIRAVRRRNVEVLLTGLQDLKNYLTTIVDFSKEALQSYPAECPLFLPVKVEDGQRDALRKYLISQSIYCPVHWPLSELHEGISTTAREVYNMELSLICDQRYGLEDMLRIVDCIHEFYKK